MRRNAWKTYNRNLNRLAIRRARAEGPKKVKDGLIYREVASAASVIYCGACGGPVVDSPVARQRHAAKSDACRMAMGL